MDRAGGMSNVHVLWEEKGSQPSGVAPDPQVSKRLKSSSKRRHVCVTVTLFTVTLFTVCFCC